MKLVNINKNGTQKFQLKDGRIIYSYNSGYVRIDSGLDRLYQINKVRKYTKDFECWSGETTTLTYVERVLIPCPHERFQYIKDWVKRNTFYGDYGNVLPYSLIRKLRQKDGVIKYLKNRLK